MATNKSSTFLKSPYRWHRVRGLAAVDAMAKARTDAAAGTTRYPSSASKAGFGTSGEPFAAYGERHMRWIESPAAAGLRFVGTAEEISRRQHSQAVNHTGWYIDDFQGETAVGVVYQMAACDGRPRFIPGYADPWNGKPDNDGPACLSFDEIFVGDTRTSTRPNCISRATVVLSMM